MADRAGLDLVTFQDHSYVAKFHARGGIPLLFTERLVDKQLRDYAIKSISAVA
ncbi:hypothetical protein [Mycolicibacterium sp. XJ879]